MINLKAFREFCTELVADVNNKSVIKINRLEMAVSEAHMIKKLNRAKGVILCVTYPDARGKGDEDNLKEDQAAYFFIVRKVAPGSENDDEEVLNYTELQNVMLFLRNSIRDSVGRCMDIVPDNDYRIEWEYQIFGGFNGLSLGIKFENHD